MKSCNSTKLVIEYADLKSDKIIGEIDISTYDLAVINQLCPPEIADDLEYCNGGFIEKDQFSLLQEYITELKPFTFGEYDYCIMTYGIS